MLTAEVVEDEVPFEEGWVKLRGFPPSVGKHDIRAFLEARRACPCCCCWCGHAAVRARQAAALLLVLPHASRCLATAAASPLPRRHHYRPAPPPQGCAPGLPDEDIKLVQSADGTPLGEAFVHLRGERAKLRLALAKDRSLMPVRPPGWSRAAVGPGRAVCSQGRRGAGVGAGDEAGRAAGAAGRVQAACQPRLTPAATPSHPAADADVPGGGADSRGGGRAAPRLWRLRAGVSARTHESSRCRPPIPALRLPL